ncbi:hypothetical protein PPH93_04170 [Achromobacter xylosoxidans]|uniref:hypothetical protein n=1 Tax=Alcaligenes xylosoxydans xylosoxydans TaxID=85698 RepID=UPI0012DBD27E|nr:hypothetical protein [Achromobacter xylosoxidans]MDC6160821.1 hypothetical protein [Achromobacter xylosoxidans]
MGIQQSPWFGAQCGASKIQITIDPKKELFIPWALRYCAGIARATGPRMEGDPVS